MATAELDKQAQAAVGTLSFECPWCSQWVSCPIGQSHVQTKPGRSWHLAHCKNPKCDRCVLVLAEGAPNFTVLDGRAAKITIYPSPTPTYEEAAVPQGIRAEFTEAMRCQAAGYLLGAALVGRRVLQSAIRACGGVGRNLQEEIDSVQALSDSYKAHAHQVRLIGNDAAHADPVAQTDVVDLMDFTDLVLQELYVNPARLAAAKQRRQEK